MTEHHVLSERNESSQWWPWLACVVSLRSKNRSESEGSGLPTADRSLLTTKKLGTSRVYGRRRPPEADFDRSTSLQIQERCGCEQHSRYIKMPKGLVKAKKYDWKDSNLANFGSDEEKQVKKESAEQEPAWQGAGEQPGLKIWRIVQFKVEQWPEEDYGEFYNGDSYIILNTYKDEDSEELNHDVHFWIGKNSTQDEYGTAAYKTVELDTFLDDKPVQHREVQGHESSLFKSYFKKGIQTMEGGAETGFRHVEPETYEARLLHFFKDKKGHIVVREIPRARSRVSSGDVYILDAGLMLYQFNGSSCSPMEKAKAMEYISKMKGKRGEAKSVVLDEADTSSSHEFFKHLDEEPGEDEVESDDEDGDDDKKLLRVNADTRATEEVKEGNVTLDDFKSDDVFIYDSGETVFVWVGSNASSTEKRNGLPLGHSYLSSSMKPWRSITVIKEGIRSKQFTSALAA